MYETIIVPVDVNNAEKASDMLKAAERMGGKNTKVVLLNVIETVPNYVAVHLPEEFREQAVKKATEGLSSIAESTSLETEIGVRSGHASTEILTVADEKNADAIIIASHSPGLEDYFLGSTAARVVRHAKCTVVVIR